MKHHRRGLRLHAGHDLDLTNLAQFIALCPEVAEVSIGHALLGDALEFGIAETVRRYRYVIPSGAKDLKMPNSAL